MGSSSSIWKWNGTSPGIKMIVENCQRIMLTRRQKRLRVGWNTNFSSFFYFFLVFFWLMRSDYCQRTTLSSIFFMGSSNSWKWIPVVIGNKIKFVFFVHWNKCRILPKDNVIKPRPLALEMKFIDAIKKMWALSWSRQCFVSIRSHFDVLGT